MKEIKHLKANITATKPHYLQKVIYHSMKIEDALDGRFSSSLQVFIPKLTVKHPSPTCMLWAGNGNGRCLIRLSNPTELAGKLRMLADIITSDIWLDIFLELESTSERLIMGDANLLRDNKFTDIP